MKKFFLLPGFRQKATDKQFLWLKKFLTEKGLEVVLVPITWERKTMTDYAAEFEAFYSKNKGKENYILGFSYGAVITFITAEKLKPEKVFLCSLSPDFKEDIKNEKQWILDYVGKNRTADSLTRSGREIAKKLSVPAVIFFGEKEGKQYPKLKKRCEETARLAKKARLVVIKDAPHNISHPEYIKALKQELK